MRRNKEIISENLKLRKLAGVLPLLSFTLPPQLYISLSETDKSRMKAFCGENGLGGVVAARKTEQCLPVQDLKGGLFYKQKVSSEAFMAAIKGAGGSGEGVMFSSLL